MIAINSLNSKHEYLSPLMRLEKLFATFAPEKILMTSSFGTSSAVLLHLVSKVRPSHPIYFIDTRYHFKETLEYKNQLSELLNLNVIEVKAPENRAAFTRNHKSYTYNQDLCCHINKVMPVDELKEKHDFWLSGLLRFQNENRSKLKLFEQQSGIIKVHAILDMTAKEVELYKYINELPDHPLVGKGYHSVGCSHCTTRGIGRQGRWANKPKAECGLHSQQL